MRNPHNLRLSRHNIYYFRFSIPPALHPQARRSEIKLSLATQCSHEALQLSRYLMYFGDTFLRSPGTASMQHHEIKQMLTDFFTVALNKRKVKMRELGHLSTFDRLIIKNTIDFADDAIATNIYDLAPDPMDFIKLKGLPIETGTKVFMDFRHEYLTATSQYYKEVLDFDDSLSRYDFSSRSPSVNVIVPIIAISMVLSIFYAPHAFSAELVMDKDNKPVALTGLLEPPVRHDGCSSASGTFIVDEIAYDGVSELIGGIRLVDAATPYLEANPNKPMVLNPVLPLTCCRRSSC